MSSSSWVILSLVASSQRLRKSSGKEAIFALLSQAADDVFFHFGAEAGLVLRCVRTVHFCEQFSIYGARFHFCLGTLLFILGDILAEAVGIGFHLLLYHLVGRFDRVLGQFVLAVQFGIKLRSYSDVESEGEGVLVIEVDVLGLCVVGQRFAQDLQVFLLDVLLQVLTYEFVEYISQDTLAVHLLHQAGGNHSRTETGHLRFVAHFFQLLSHFVLIVSRFDRDLHHSHQVFQFTLFNFHNI